MQKFTLEIRRADEKRTRETVLLIEKTFATFVLTLPLHGGKVSWTADLQVLMGQKSKKPKTESLFESRTELSFNIKCANRHELPSIRLSKMTDSPLTKVSSKDAYYTSCHLNNTKLQRTSSAEHCIYGLQFTSFVHSLHLWYMATLNKQD